MTRAGIIAFFAAAVVLLITGVGAGAGAPAPNSAVSGAIVFDGVWTARTGQPQFQAVINQFERLYPKVHVEYRPIGPGLPIALAEGGAQLPDMADVPQPGAVQQLVNEGKLKRITYADAVISQNFAPRWKEPGK